MAKVLVRAEGVNFAATVFDTNDLSTIRGASLAVYLVTSEHADLDATARQTFDWDMP